MGIPATSERVTIHTSEEVDRKIQLATSWRIQECAGHPRTIERRLRELDQEWDMERVLETNASSLALTGLLLGITVNRKFLVLPLVVLGFFLQHAIQGWCPPVPLLRRMGYRTQTEIETERYALRLLRGDFDGIAKSGKAKDVDEVLKAVGLPVV